LSNVKLVLLYKEAFGGNITTFNDCFPIAEDDNFLQKLTSVRKTKKYQYEWSQQYFLSFFRESTII